MTKTLALVVCVTLGLSACLSAAGCYALGLLSPRPLNALVEDQTVVNAVYIREMEEGWSKLPPSPERDRAEKDWRARYAEETRAVYAKHGQTPPEWTNLD